MKLKTYSISKVYTINSVHLFQIVSDFENYDKWNTVIPSGKGKLVIGKELSLILKLNNQTKPFNPKVISINNENSFSLSKVLIVKEIGELTHKFDFISLSNNTTEFIQTWTGRGILMKILWSKIEKGFLDFNIFNDDLEKYVEKRNANNV